ncbi:hypothetical protein RI103_04400 [Paraburkholderia sp. FT54]|uniref:hypothetical protein n=1 Tax=Paraburkholderia sp. FT54 TaxID=3074437 RepID=UPI0028774888|nr:hypothetical protein [Paraburkholderia sp. FT54]WNC90608.1 hypothetical protein RI103_04400 [Paraburkholderia sp. FT54]
MSAARLISNSVAPPMTVREVRRRGAAVLRAHPQLTVQGWPDKRMPDAGREFDYEQVRAAVLFLLALGRPRRTFNKNAYSYRLKHNAENWAGENGLPDHILNGAFILAALICGYRHDNSAHINCVFDMVVSPEMRRYDWHVYKRNPGSPTDANQVTE